MRHRKDTVKLGRTSSHRRCLVANMLKSLIVHGRIETTLSKGKLLCREADQLITLAKENSMDAKRRAIAALMVRYNSLTPKEMRAAKEGKKGSYNNDRQVISKLFDDIGPRFPNRAGGYTRLVRLSRRVGDNASTCVLEILPE